MTFQQIACTYKGITRWLHQMCWPCLPTTCTVESPSPWPSSPPPPPSSSSPSPSLLPSPSSPPPPPPPPLHHMCLPTTCTWFLTPLVSVRLLRCSHFKDWSVQLASARRAIVGDWIREPVLYMSYQWRPHPPTHIHKHTHIRTYKHIHAHMHTEVSQSNSMGNRCSRCLYHCSCGLLASVDDISVKHLCYCHCMEIQPSAVCVHKISFTDEWMHGTWFKGHCNQTIVLSVY